MPVQFEDSEAIRRIMMHLPADICEKHVRKIFNECNGDEIETICNILNVATKDESKKDISTTQKMWDNIRQICDSYDNAVHDAIHKST